jgi:hypothetical protein
LTNSQTNQKNGAYIQGGTIQATERQVKIKDVIILAASKTLISSLCQAIK